MKTADLLASEGFLEAGYDYIGIDDCWSEFERDENQRLVANKERFPNGMKYVADYVNILFIFITQTIENPVLKNR